jgi:hypothetical protein
MSHPPRDEITRRWKICGPLWVSGLRPTILTGALAMLGLAAAGCDFSSNSADRVAQQDVAQAVAARQGGDQSGNESAMHLLSRAASQSEDLSPETQAYVRSTIAAAEADQSRGIVRSIREKQLEYDRLCNEIGELLNKIDSLHTTRTNYQKFDPRPTQDGIAKLIADAQGSDDQPIWAGLGVDSIPSLAKVTANITRLEAALAKNQEQQRLLTEKRAAKLDEAEQAQKSADATQGQESIDEFIRAANLRREASDFSIQLEVVQGAAVPLQQDLDVAQAQQAQIQETIRLLHEQSDALDVDFKAVQDQAAAQDTMAGTILQGGNGNGGAEPAPATNAGQPGEIANTVAAKAAALAALAQEIAAMREQAQTGFNDAENYFEQAAASGTKVQRDMERLLSLPSNATSKFRPIWEAVRDTFHPNVFRRQKAVVDREAGNLFTSAARSLQLRANLQQQASRVLNAAGLDVPKELDDPSVATDLQTAVSSAEDRYKSADDTLQGIIQGIGVPGVQSVAKVDRVLTLYDWAIKSRVAGDAPAAKAHLADAIQQKNDAEGAIFPPLPGELATAGPAAPATPGTIPPAGGPGGAAAPGATRRPAAPAAGG